MPFFYALAQGDQVGKLGHLIFFSCWVVAAVRISSISVLILASLKATRNQEMPIIFATRRVDYSNISYWTYL